MSSPAKSSVIRSFVRREGRLTPGQARAIETHWQRYGIDREPGQTLDLAKAFGPPAPLVLDIGFGNGESLLAMAEAMPDHHLVGIDVYRPGVGACLLRLVDKGLTNVRLMHDDAQEMLRESIADESLDMICIFFPDPWPKKRHHKRRMIQPDFVELLSHRLKPGGRLHLATDWQPYAEHMAEVLDASASLTRMDPASPWVERPDYRPVTRYQRRGEKLGHPVRDLVYIKP